MAKDKEGYPLNKAEIERHQAYLQQTILYLEQDDMARHFLVSLLNKITGNNPLKEEVLLPQNRLDAAPHTEAVSVERVVYKDKIVEKRVEIPVERIVEKTVEVIPQWVQALEPQLSFLQQVQAHTEIATILLPSGKASLVQLIATAAQWSNVLRVWDALATQVKSSKQAVSVAEQQILEHSLALFNLTLQSNQASLQLPEGGAAYDYDVHQKVSGSGGSIEQVLLAGLYNAAGEKVRASIVTTR